MVWEITHLIAAFQTGQDVPGTGVMKASGTGVHDAYGGAWEVPR
jgi:hypothetical protein